MQKQTRIQIEDLPLVKDPQTFFSTDKVLVVDVLDITADPNLTKLKAQIQKRAFMYSQKLFMPLLLKGNPENLFLKAKKGFSYTFLGHTTWVLFDGDLNDLLDKRKVYDISSCYRKKNLVFDCENDFLIERYITPYVPVDDGYKTPCKKNFPGNILVEEF